MVMPKKSSKNNPKLVDEIKLASAAEEEDEKPQANTKFVHTNLKMPEYEQMRIIRDYLYKNGVLKKQTDYDFLRYCVRHVMIEFTDVLQGGLHKDVG
jgi:hypothetical protein